MNEKVMEVKREIARNKVQLRNERLTDNEREELLKEQNYLKQKLYYERLNEIFGRMEKRIDDKHKRR